MQGFLDAICAWVAHDTSIDAALLVGSCARGTNRLDSDIDLVLVSTEKQRLLLESRFPALFGTVERMCVEDYGPCTSLRVYYKDGPEVEFGIVEPSWVDIPLDAGTRGVLRDGYRVLADKHGYFAGLTI